MLLKVDEVAQRLRLSRNSIYGRVHSGAIRAVRLGDGPRAPLRVAEDELERYLAAAAREEER